MKVFSNLAISLDGRIADAVAPTKSLGTPLDRRTMQVIRALSDVIIVGASTLRAHPEALRIKGPVKPKRRRAAPANAVVTASGNLDPDWGFWKATDIIRFVFTTDEGLSKARESARDRAFVVSCGSKRVSVESMLKRLKQSDYENVLVEGGGRLIGEFVAENYLQELYVTHTPWILGGPDNPLLVDNPLKLEQWRKLKLLKLKKISQELYGHYRIIGARHV